MKALQHQSGRRPIVNRAADGSFPLLIGLETDTIGATTRRVSEAGGSATVIVPHGDYLAPLGLMIDSPGEHEGRVECERGQIHPESTLGMLVEYLQRCADKETHWCITTPDGDVDVVEIDDWLTVPA